MNRTVQSFLCALSLLVLVMGICYSQENAPAGFKPYLVFDETTSPDGRYAIAWGLPKHPDVWAKVCEFDREDRADPNLKNEGLHLGDEEVFQRVDDVAEDVENYVVDLREGKIIHRLQSGESACFFAGGVRPNRHHLEVVWSNTGKLVLINHTYRWDCVTFCALPIGNKHVGPELDLNKRLGDAARRFAAKSFPAGSGYSKNELNISFSDLKQVGDAKFSTHADVANGKKELPSDLDSDLEFGIASVNGRLTLKTLGVHQPSN